MSPEVVGIFAVVGLFVLLSLGIPIAFVLAFVGLAGYIAISGMEPALRISALIPFSKVASYHFTVIPLFLLMGYLSHYAGLPTGLFRAARAWVGGLPGGLVQATIIGSTALGAVSGSGMASCSLVAKIMVPEMLSSGIDRRIAFGAVAAAGTISAMIPPSILMVTYGIIAEQSVGQLLIAGIVPGIITGLNYMIMVYIRVRRNPKLVPSTKLVSWRERFVALKDAWGTVIIAAVIMGGIYSGVFTPTEAGGVGAFAVFIMALPRLRRTQFLECLYEAIRTTGMIFFLISCAFIFGYTISVSRLPYGVSEFLAALPRWSLLAGVMVMYLILGFFLDMIAALFITLPIILPAIEAAGFSLIWFGVLIVHLCEVALLTPPFALNIFVLKGTIPEADIRDVIGGVWPFVLVDLITLAIFIAFPQVALFLPEMMTR